MQTTNPIQVDIQKSWNNAAALVGPGLAPEWFEGAPGPMSQRTLANRRNSQKSTGPRTADGKERASLNATRHGLSSAKLLIPGECAVELEQFNSEQCQRLCPRNGLEEELVEQYSRAKWRMARLEKLEGTIVSRHLWNPDPDKNPEDTLIQLGHLTRYESGLRRTMFRCLELMTSSRKSGAFPDATGPVIDAVSSASSTQGNGHHQSAAGSAPESIEPVGSAGKPPAQNQEKQNDGRDEHKQ